MYGIVKQSGGSISLQSEPELGSTFRVYFPAASTPGKPAISFATISASDTRGDETILLVEDEEQLRTVARGILQGAGYKVIAASDGKEALTRHAKDADTIDLLLTDVVMPHMSGRELAEHLKQLRPELKILYMSGYTADAVVLHEVMMASVDYIQKPLTPELLLLKVRKVLDSA